MAADTQVSVDLAREFIARSRFYLNDEYRTKMRRAVEVIPPDAIWARPNDKSNSVGNLLVHLAGNVRQWIVSGVGGEADTRDRQAEFSARSGPPAEELLERLEDVLTGRSIRRDVERTTDDSGTRPLGHGGGLLGRSAFLDAPWADHHDRKGACAGCDSVLRGYRGWQGEGYLE